MHTQNKPTPAAIREARANNPKARERDLALELGISEAELVAAHCGESAIRVQPDANMLLSGLEPVGEVMALTRNNSVVHEKIGIYDKVVTGKHHALALGKDIDLRIFPKMWAHGFAVEKRDGDAVRRSLQFFDSAGDAVHKVHLRPASDLGAYNALVQRMRAEDQSQTIETRPIEIDLPANDDVEASAGKLRERWDRMTDVHQFFGMLKALKLSRHQAVNLIGGEYAWRLDDEAVTAMMRLAVNETLPIMCFVGSSGCVQIHSGVVHEIKMMGPWLNVLDPTFHLHLRTDHIHEAWVVRKPTKDGHVTSIEGYDANRELIVQFFGVREEGSPEREEWRSLVERLPRVAQSSAA